MIADRLSYLMNKTLDPSHLVRTARMRAGLSQRALAERAGTAQSVVARVESGTTDPSSATLRRLLEAADVELRCSLVDRPVPDSHMLEDVDRILALTPEQRLDEVARVDRFLRAARRA